MPWNVGFSKLKSFEILYIHSISQFLGVSSVCPCCIFRLIEWINDSYWIWIFEKLSFELSNLQHLINIILYSSSPFFKVISWNNLDIFVLYSLISSLIIFSFIPSRSSSFFTVILLSCKEYLIIDLSVFNKK